MLLKVPEHVAVCSRSPCSDPPFWGEGERWGRRPRSLVFNDDVAGVETRVDAPEKAAQT